MRVIITFCLFINLGFAEIYNVTMSDMKFFPEVLRIKKNDIVIFTNTSNSIHNVVSIKPKIVSPYLLKGHTFRVKFLNPGKVDYYCELHRAMLMKGTIFISEN